MAQLKCLAKDAEARALKAINWYLQRKEEPKRNSQSVRKWAILLAIFGGLMPMLSTVVGSTATSTSIASIMDRLGYVFIALAGAILTIDRYAGYSTTWMRYMNTQTALQRTLEKFQLDWSIWLLQVMNKNAAMDAEGDQLEATDLNTAIALLTHFHDDIRTLIDQEVQLWISEFKDQLQNLQSGIAKSSTDQRMGNIVVCVTRVGELSQALEIHVDNVKVRQTDANATLLSAIPPGNHLVRVSTRADDGTSVEASQNVQVAPGQTVSADLTLTAPTPTPKPSESPTTTPTPETL